MGLEDYILQPGEVVEEEIIEEKRPSRDIFCVINDIRNGRGMHPVEVDYHMNPYMTNKALTQHPDTLFAAQAMNQRWQLDKILQYDFLFHEVRKYKRAYGKWLKKEKNEEVELLMEYYDYNRSKAQAVLPLHSDEMLRSIKKRFGGTNEKRSKKIT